MAYLVKDLSPEQRVVLESLLGRALSEHEAVAVRAYEPPSLFPERRAEIIAALEAHFMAIEAAREPTAREDADLIFEEAMRQTRPDYRAHR